MRFDRRSFLGLASAGLAASCAGRAVTAGTAGGAEITFESFDNSFDAIIDTAQQGRLLSTGHWWSEGPAWDAARETLYFSDVPRNIAYAWSQGSGDRPFLSPSGGRPDETGGMREAGTNGLLMGQSGELLICNHGSRAVEALDIESGHRRVLAAEYEGARFNSPNDLVQAHDGTIYFTDPPYGLEGLDDSPLKEMAVNGVYRLSRGGELSRLVDDMTFPNGVQLSPDEATLYVAQSDPDEAIIRAFDLRGDAPDSLGEGETWFEAAPYMEGVQGLPDGMAVATTGHVFLAGPGGVLVIDPQGQCLGRISTGRASANCAFGEDGKTLFITASDRLVSVRTRLTGMGTF